MIVKYIFIKKIINFINKNDTKTKIKRMNFLYNYKILIFFYLNSKILNFFSSFIFFHFYHFYQHFLVLMPFYYFHYPLTPKYQFLIQDFHIWIIFLSYYDLKYPKHHYHFHHVYSSKTIHQAQWINLNHYFISY